MMIPPSDDGILDNRIVTGPEAGRVYLEQLLRDIPLVEAFCWKKDVFLTKIALCDENYPQIEIVYAFNDGLGGYTIAGIRNSL